MINNKDDIYIKLCYVIWYTSHTASDLVPNVSSIWHCMSPVSQSWVMWAGCWCEDPDQSSDHRVQIRIMTLIQSRAL